MRLLAAMKYASNEKRFQTRCKGQPSVFAMREVLSALLCTADSG